MPSRHVKIAPGGRVVLPAEFRKALGVSVGDNVVIEIKDGELRLRSLDAAIKRARRRSGNTSRRESRWLTG